MRQLPYLAARPHLALPCRRDPKGLTGPTKAEAAGPNWRRSSRGLHVLADVELTTEQRILEAACLLPEYGGVTGWASLNWQGGTRWFGGTTAAGADLPVCLATAGDDIRPQRGVRISGERLDPRDLVVVDGISLTSAVRSTCYEMRYAADTRLAAVMLSMAAYYDLVSIEELAVYAAQHSGWIGIPQCRAAISLAEENCWSPPELDLVLTWRIDADLPRPLCNHPVFDLGGRHIGTPDMIDVEAGVVGQYNGSLHLASAQAWIDVQAEERYRSVGLECFTMLAADRKSPDRMAERMVAARSRARWEAESRRAWTVAYPSWWTPTHSVALRRQLTDEQRDLWLRYRAA